MSTQWYAIATPQENIAAFSSEQYVEDIAIASKETFVSVQGTNTWQSASDIGRMEGIDVASDLGGDSSAAVGTAIPVMKRYRERAGLISLVNTFAQNGYSCTAGRVSTVTHESARAAKVLFQRLLPAYKTPKIAPDGEGGLLAVWEDPEHSVVLVVDDWRLHLVVDAATPDARYFDDLDFDGVRVPDVVASAIPR